MSKVVVAGSIITDMSVKVKNHPKVGETVIATDVQYSPGGKGANQAVAAARLGANTAMIGAIGNDDFGKMSLEFLEKQEIEVSHIFKNEQPTGIAMIQVSTETANNSIAVVLGANETLEPHNVDDYIYRKGDVLVSQFEIPLKTVKRFFHKGKHANCINILNPAPALLNKEVKDILKLTDILIVNETELEVVAPDVKVKGFEWITTTQEAREAKEDIFRAFLIQTRTLLNISILIVTLGEKGSYGVVNSGDVIYVPSLKVNAVDTTGAGDCYVGALAAYIAENTISSLSFIYNSSVKSLEQAMVFANKAASLSVQKKGSGISMPYLKDI